MILITIIIKFKEKNYLMNGKTWLHLKFIVDLANNKTTFEIREGITGTLIMNWIDPNEKQLLPI
jgi:hypothetical protein